MARDDTLEVADIGEILRLLPHRYPFLLVDRVINIRDDQHGIGIKNLTVNEPFLACSAKNLVIPGVLVIEGMAQTAGVMALRSLPPTDRRRFAFFMSIDKAKFRKPAGPGDTLEYHIESSPIATRFGGTEAKRRLVGYSSPRLKSAWLN
jgi:3-hydroxyacyl-[acyl-carrier-protein] dehydratase